MRGNNYLARLWRITVSFSKNYNKAAMRANVCWLFPISAHDHNVSTCSRHLQTEGTCSPVASSVDQLMYRWDARVCVLFSWGFHVGPRMQSWRWVQGFVLIHIAVLCVCLFLLVLIQACCSGFLKNQCFVHRKNQNNRFRCSQSTALAPPLQAVLGPGNVITTRDLSSPE